QRDRPPASDELLARIGRGFWSGVVRPPWVWRESTGSDVEQEVHHVAVLDQVVAALQPALAALPHSGVAARVDQLLPATHLGPDEPLGKAGVDGAGGVLGVGPLRDRPGPNLLLPGGEEGLQAKSVVSGPAEPAQSGLR